MPLEAQDNPFPSVLFRETVDPANPLAGDQRLFVDTDHLLKLRDSAGTVTTYPTSAGLTDPMTTRGDVIVRNASNVTSRLAIGTTGKVLSSDGTDISWQTPSSGFSDPMTTRGDVIVRNASNVTARLGIGSSGKVLSSDGTDVSWQTPSAGITVPTAAAYKRTAGTYTSPTSSSTFVDVDGTNLSLTITTLARRVMVGLVAMGDSTAAGIYGSVDVDLDGTRLGGGASGLHIWLQHDAGLQIYNVGFVYLTDVLTAASHTFKLQWHNNSGATAVRLAGTSSQPLRFWVAETMHTS